jgi:hypothetical protein
VTSEIQRISELAARFGSAWNRFWFTPADARVPSLLRLLTGLLAVYYLLSHTSDLIVWFGPYGLLPADTVRQLTGGGGGEPTFRPTLLNHLTTTGGLWAFHAVALLIAVGFTAGLYSRVTNVLTLAVVLCYVHRAPMITGQFEPVLTMLLCYLALAPTGAYWSLDQRFRKTPPGEAVKKWDRLRAETAKTVENQRSRRCLYQFFHSLDADAARSSLGANVSIRLIQLHSVGPGQFGEHFEQVIGDDHRGVFLHSAGAHPGLVSAQRMLLGSRQVAVVSVGDPDHHGPRERAAGFDVQTDLDERFEGDGADRQIADS